MRRTGAAMALSAGVLLACASPEDRAAAPDRPESDPVIEVIGDVMVAGSERDTMLVIVTKTEQYELVGDLAAELRRLQPFGVTVRGRVVRQAAGPVFPAQLQVDSYTLAQRPS